MSDMRDRQRVKVVDAKPTYWYANLIGEMFEVYDNGRDYVLADDYDRGPRAMWCHIDRDDAVVVEVDDDT